MRDHGDLLSETAERELGDIEAIDLNRTFLKLNDARESHEDGRLAGASAPNDTDLLSLLNFEAKTSQDQVGVGSVAQLGVFELYLAAGWPLSRRFNVSVTSLLGDLMQVVDTLGLGHLAHGVVDTGDDVHQPVHVDGPVEELHQRKSILRQAVLGDHYDTDQGE